MRADRDAGFGETLELLPRGDGLVAGPPRAATDLLGRDEELGPEVGVPEQWLDAVAEGVVDRDDVAARRQIGLLAGVEGCQLCWCERSKPKQPQEADLTRELRGSHVEPLLADLTLAREPVVVERDVGASRQAPPLGRCRGGANARPELDVRGPPGPREADERPPRDPPLPARVEPRAGLGAREPPRISAERLDGEMPALLRPLDRRRPLRHPRPVVSRT